MNSFEFEIKIIKLSAISVDLEPGSVPEIGLKEVVVVD